MGKFTHYLGLAMAIIYLLFGLYLLLGVYLVSKPIAIANQNIFGGLLVGYGVFRLYRFFKNSQVIPQ